MDYFFNAEDIFRIAVMIEDNGEKFYNHINTLIPDAKAKEICARLAGEEQKHRLMFEKLLSELVNQKGITYNFKHMPEDDLTYLQELSASNVFTRTLNLKNISARIKSTKDAITIALGFEKDTIFFFIQMKKFTRPEWGQSEIDKLIEQEETHIKILTNFLKEQN